jgi:hypothetical protein
MSSRQPAPSGAKAAHETEQVGGLTGTKSRGQKKAAGAKPQTRPSIRVQAGRAVLSTVFGDEKNPVGSEKPREKDKKPRNRKNSVGGFGRGARSESLVSTLLHVLCVVYPIYKVALSSFNFAVV